MSDGRRRRMQAVWVVVAALLSGAAATPVRAQDAAVPTASVLRTSVTGSVDASLAEAVDRLVRARLDTVNVLAVTGSVTLDLRDVQLALGCVGETDACLQAAATELDVQALVLPSLVQNGDETMLSIGYFQVGASPALRRVASRMRGSTATLEAVDGLLRQLFPNARFPDEHVGNGGGGGGGGGSHYRHGASLSPLPVVIASAGAVAIAVGIAFGVSSQSSHDDYMNADFGSFTMTGEADAAFEHLDDAKSAATIANIMFITGGVLLAGGITWGIIELSSGSGGDAPRDTRTVRLTPMLGPNGGGVLIGGAL